MAAIYSIHRNYDSTDTEAVSYSGPLPQITGIVTASPDPVDWSRDNYNFLGWNDSRDGSGNMYQPGDTPAAWSVFAIWEEAVVVPDVTISYNGDVIASFSGSGTEVLETNGKLCEDDITIDYTKPTPNLQSKTASPTTSSQTITADSGYDGLSSVTVNAMPSGTAGTPTATKGTVSNHSVSVTPSVTNTTGYITGGTKTGTAVTVSASELVSGTKSITSSGTTDVTNYASASVASGSATTPATTITANPAISVSASGLITASVSKTQDVTPSVSAGYVSSGMAGTVTVNGSNTQQLTVYNGAHHQPTPSVNTVTVSLTNPVNPSEFSYCNVEAQLSSTEGDSGGNLGAISSPTGSITVSVPTGIFGVNVAPSGISIYVPRSGISCTGDVSYYGADHIGGFMFEVTGNGTITFDGIDYDD